MTTDIYEAPLSARYASDKMKKLFSADSRYQTWRRLWLSLARAEKETGLSIGEDAIKELEAHITDIDYEQAAKWEKKTRHDVMAHIHTYGQAAPSAAGILHLGATSCYVTDNADLILYREALKLIREEVGSVIGSLCDFAERYKDLPTLGYTHYQPAQLTTVGKRATLWIQDFVSDLAEVDFALNQIKFLGCRGATGTEASFMELFAGDTDRIDRMNDLISADFGFSERFDVSGQTYPRKVDSRILNALSSIAQSAGKMANDIRLLQHDRQLEEPREDAQIGSSTMAYKRNPMRCERICSLSRYLISLAENAAYTASQQWLERTLDDSANRRISMPEGFLAADSILRLAINVTSGLVVNKPIIHKTVMEQLPFIATENLMMEAVKRGGDRQKIHEIIRRCSMASLDKMSKGKACDLITRLADEEEFGLSEADLRALLDPKRYIGRSTAQAEAYLMKVRRELGDMERVEVNIDR